MKTIILNKPYFLKPERMLGCALGSIQQRNRNPQRALKELARKLQYDTGSYDDELDETDETPIPEIVPIFGGISVIPIFGCLAKHPCQEERDDGIVDIDSIRYALASAIGTLDSQAVLLWFDCDGGDTTGVEECAQFISQMDVIKPVYAYTDSSCNSAGYYLASQCRNVYCSPSSTIGNVGVWSLLTDTTEMFKEEGIDILPVYAGKYKLAGAPFVPNADKPVSRFQADVDTIYNKFVADVKAKRNIPDNKLDGWSYLGTDAVQFGYADGLIPTIEETLMFLINSTINNNPTNSNVLGM